MGLRVLALVGLFTGCGDSPAIRIDADSPDAADAGIDAAVTFSTSELATGICDRTTAVAVSPNGARVAFLRCVGDALSGHVYDFDTESISDLDAMVVDYRIEFAPDGDHVIFGDGKDFFLQRADGETPAERLAAGDIDDFRFSSVDVDGSTVHRLLILEHRADVGASDRLIVRRSSDTPPYSESDLIDDVTSIQLAGEIGVLSATGDTLVSRKQDPEPDTPGTPDSFQMFGVSFGGSIALPHEDFWTFPETGVYDEHLFGFDSSTRLVYFPAIDVEGPELASDVDLDDGFLAMSEGTMRRVYYVSSEGVESRTIEDLENGDTVVNDASMIVADATSFVLSPDRSFLIASNSNDQLYAVRADVDSTPPTLLAENAGLMVTEVVFGENQIAAVAGDDVFRARLNTALSGERLPASNPEDLEFAGDGSRLCWREGDAFYCVAMSSETSVSITDGVHRVYARPTTPHWILVTPEGDLVSLAFE